MDLSPIPAQQQYHQNNDSFLQKLNQTTVKSNTSGMHPNLLVKPETSIPKARNLFTVKPTTACDSDHTAANSLNSKRHTARTPQNFNLTISNFSQNTTHLENNCSFGNNPSFCQPGQTSRRVKNVNNKNNDSVLGFSGAQTSIGTSRAKAFKKTLQDNSLGIQGQFESIFGGVGDASQMTHGTTPLDSVRTHINNSRAVTVNPMGLSGRMNSRRNSMMTSEKSSNFNCKQASVFGYRRTSLPVPVFKGYTELPPPEMDRKGIAVPRNMSISQRVEDNDVDLVRKRIRLNNIDHKNFDTVLRNPDTIHYFSGIYERNNPKHIRETKEGSTEPRNLYVALEENRQKGYTLN